ncbi:uncharacterized protein BCR38DRAFT_411504 [Pseudomassariella vexata]|uniref:Uncharacterized protein n=1 Tax=Pseudomassariella vexata TaxID=1141098 RepID=A0A1Y2DQV2_9PEZI|nr:uncharacterized protein BCR38DRAFT_411504 [Pseudomassariella vexata]ORY61650.1 hypothetical protein BCR38DRAFT_411504 [Pseudomassariella vexata]
MASLVSYNIAYTALMGILVLALLPLFITACVVIHRRRDTARLGFIWLKLALFWMFLGSLLVAIGNTLIVFVQTDVLDNLTGTWDYVEATARISDFGYYFEALAEIFTLLSLVNIGLGILCCWDVMRKTRRVLKWVTYGFAIMETVFALAELILYEAWLTAYYRDESISSRSHLEAMRKLGAAYVILLWIAVLAVIGFSSFVVALSQKRAAHRKAAVLLLVASIMDFICHTWNLATDGTWVFSGLHRPGTYDTILEAVLGYWPRFVALVFLFVVGSKKMGGLWSTAQNFAPPNQYFNYGAQSMAQQPYPQQHAPQKYAQPQGYPQQPQQGYGLHTYQPRAGLNGSHWQQPAIQHELGNQNERSVHPQVRSAELRGSETASELQSHNGLY